jgi:transcriptional regulator with XRE-family HTH domain
MARHDSRRAGCSGDISQNYLSEIETGRRKGPAKLQKKFARALGVPIDLLID